MSGTCCTIDLLPVWKVFQDWSPQPKLETSYTCGNSHPETVVLAGLGTFILPHRKRICPWTCCAAVAFCQCNYAHVSCRTGKGIAAENFWARLKFLVWNVCKQWQRRFLNRLWIAAQEVERPNQTRTWQSFLSGWMYKSIHLSALRRLSCCSPGRPPCFPPCRPHRRPPCRQPCPPTCRPTLSPN